MIFKRRCGGDCESCRLGCRGKGDEEAPVRNMNTAPRGTNPEDLRRLQGFLSERYDSQSLMLAVISMYGQGYIREYGMANAMESYLDNIAEDMRLRIAREDIRKIADAVIQRGDITY